MKDLYDVSGYSIGEIKDALRNIDREKFPERVALLEDALNKPDRRPIKEVYEERGGMRFGHGYWSGMNVTFPFVKLELTTDYLKITQYGLNFISFNKKKGYVSEEYRKPSFKDEFLFKKNENISFFEKRGWFSNGIVIQHENKGFPPYMIFWSLDTDNLIDQLNVYGWTVIDIEKS